MSKKYLECPDCNKRFATRAAADPAPRARPIQLQGIGNMTDPRESIYHDLAIQPADPSPEALAKADPIDLENIKSHRIQSGGLNTLHADALIAEVEALREHETKLNGWLNEHESMLAKSRGETNDARREFKAAEALATELASAITALLTHAIYDLECNNYIITAVAQANRALAATPAKTLARARARESGLTYLRRIIDALGTRELPERHEELEDAIREASFVVIAKLDALDRAAEGDADS